MIIVNLKKNVAHAKNVQFLHSCKRFSSQTYTIYIYIQCTRNLIVYLNFEISKRFNLKLQNYLQPKNIQTYNIFVCLFVSIKKKMHEYRCFSRFYKLT